VTLAFWVGMFVKAGKLADWLTSGESRSSGAGVPLAEVLASRAFWIESAFTPMVIAIGKCAAPVVVLRAIVVRRPVEFFALASLFGATVQYVVFKSGADIHYFWPQYFVLYFALAFAQLVATLTWFTGAVVGRLNLDTPGKPLLYRRVGPGFVVYAAGENGADDGGPAAGPGVDDVGYELGR
jgi:hypothetical protein